ncbi:MAG: asparagine synthase, partial [Desulfobacterales bacterium]|nr:asparagine synthase [Desulfobacterales bacterium]
QRYWQPDAESSLQLASDDDYADALEEALTVAIKARLRSHRPASSMLSGGVDSSTVCGIAGQICRESGTGPFRTYSGVSDDMPGCRESGYINRMIAWGGLDPVLLSPAQVEKYLAELARISAPVEDPFDESWMILRLVFLAARERGNTVVMDGMGGDLVAGLTTAYPSYLLRRGELLLAFREIAASRKNFWDYDAGRLKLYAQAVRPVIVPQFLRRLRACLRRGDLNKADLKDSMLSVGFAQRTNLAERWKEFRGQRTSGFCPSLRHAHAETVVAPFQIAAIERYTRLASYCGVESRQPYFDKRVVELCVSLPWQQKAQNGYLKYCLRNVLQRVAPAEVAWRTEFDSVMWKFSDAWNETNRAKNIAAIAAGKGQLAEILDMAQLEQALSKYSNGDQSISQPVWNLVTLLGWLQRNQPVA